MLSRQQVQFVKSLHQKKFRQLHRCFVVEGEKSVTELLRSKLRVKSLIALQGWLAENQKLLHKCLEIIEVNQPALERISSLATSSPVIAVAEIPASVMSLDHSNITLMLDGIRDPGNMGTIIRIADWYGLTQIICSEDCADCYNSKVVQASMGSLFRVDILYADLENILGRNKKRVYGALLEGKNIHKMKFEFPAVLIIGNESQGISTGIKKYISDAISIPRFGDAESLNAAIATAVILDNISR